MMLRWKTRKRKEKGDTPCKDCWIIHVGHSGEAVDVGHQGLDALLIQLLDILVCVEAVRVTAIASPGNVLKLAAGVAPAVKLDSSQGPDNDNRARKCTEQQRCQAVRISRQGAHLSAKGRITLTPAAPAC